jgi:hypothetical protein
LVDAAGNVVPAQNDDKTDARSGESMLDWIDKQ